MIISKIRDLQINSTSLGLPRSIRGSHTTKIISLIHRATQQGVECLPHVFVHFENSSHAKRTTTLKQKAMIQTAHDSRRVSSGAVGPRLTVHLTISPVFTYPAPTPAPIFRTFPHLWFSPVPTIHLAVNGILMIAIHLLFPFNSVRDNTVFLRGFFIGGKTRKTITPAVSGSENKEPFRRKGC